MADMIGRVVCGAALVASIAGCGGLGESEARRILEERFARGSEQSCVWTHAGKGGYTDVDHRGIRECVASLEKAGIAKPGRCRDDPQNGDTCIAREIAPQGGAAFVNDGLAFRCGELKLVAIKGVESVSDTEAVVEYTREFDAPILKDIPYCTHTTLSRPDGGRLTKKVRFTRGADGKWEVDKDLVSASVF
jgi:hypothetical protein